MSFDDAIAQNTFVAHCVLPLEFDPSRRRLLFESNADGDLISTNHEVLDMAPFEPYVNNGAQQATDHHAHENIVIAALHAIQSGTLEKVVVSCIKHAPRTSTPLEIIFERLTERYPTAFVYMLHHPKYGTWMGATPELLLHKHGKTFRTVSLAGTQPFHAEPGLIWSEKLLHEQQVVTDFIVEKLSGIRSHAVELNGPLTAQAGPLAHLKTDIRFHSDQSSEAIIGELQPTPAVCGLPREAAYNFIQTHTSFERRLYAGRLGIRFPTGDEIHFVNLRCMQVFDDHFELHVGGGIVEGSNTEEEWQETEMKADVLRKLLQ